MLNNVIIITIASILIVMYIFISIQNKKWPLIRVMSWLLGVVMAASVMIQPWAAMFHHHFDMHMYGHLLLGMGAPLLMVLAQPVTLLLKTVPVQSARQISKLMKSRYVTFITHPIIAVLLNTGGLWLLYRTQLFSMMHESMIIYYAVHVHIFLAGYLFTAVMLQLEPTAHPYSFKYRSIIMIISVALHQILSKSFYPYPPVGVDKHLAEQGAIIMYYGGDIIELIIIFIMCKQWYHSARPEKNKMLSENY
ncbi:cytochrome c oxidase assembly protein [Macrococcoides goetzii]|nr:cytochrome c oxidase assembly protein [Macrococcus goetzii]TDM40343.1 cytochrome c oxidase assembly protein [Macrococcus goetzii]TDM45643.1 cytochrome c oxidase assembly protein [Macrococcus goetzii]TDM48684.1 cytochrome c oxidase assembly protein [Macrococcus goetzii]